MKLNLSAAKLSISTLLIMVFLLSIVSPTMAVQLPTSVKLNKTTITITVGSSETLKATVWPLSAANKAVTWTSNNSSVAKVVNGKITGAAPGTATIKVKTVEGNKTANCIVIVKAATVQPTVPAPITVKPVSTVANPTASGLPNKLTVEKGKSVNLSGMVKCSSGLEKISICVDNYYGATDGVINTRTVSGNSYNLSNISINSNHAAFTKAGTYNLEIWAKAIGGTGQKLGNLTLIVTSAKITPIIPAPITVKPVPSSVKPILPSSISLNKNSISLTAGSIETLKATVLPTNAANKAVTWSSSKTSVAEVENGRITGVSAGTTTITVKTIDGSKKANCIVIVKAATVKPTVPAPITVKPVSPTANPTASGLPKKLTVEKGQSVNMSGMVKCSSGLEKISICVDNYYGATDGIIDTRKVSGNSYNLSNISINSSHAAFAKAGTYNLEIWAKAIGGTGKKLGSLTLTVKPVLQSLKVGVDPVSIGVGKSINFVTAIYNVIGTYSDGSTKNLIYDISKSNGYSIVDPSIAKLPGNGTIIGVKEGTTTLYASYQGQRVGIAIKVTGQQPKQLTTNTINFTEKWQARYKTVTGGNEIEVYNLQIPVASGQPKFWLVVKDPSNGTAPFLYGQEYDEVTRIDPYDGGTKTYVGRYYKSWKAAEGPKNRSLYLHSGKTYYIGVRVEGQNLNEVALQQVIIPSKPVVPPTPTVPSNPSQIVSDLPAFDKGVILPDSEVDFVDIPADAIQKLLVDQGGALGKINPANYPLDPVSLRGTTYSLAYDGWNVRELADNKPTTLKYTPAQIIYWIAKDKQINPVILLAFLQKEQSLVSSSSVASQAVKDPKTFMNSRLNRAVGYACYDKYDDKKYYGFLQQISCLAWQYKEYMKHFKGSYTKEIDNKPMTIKTAFADAHYTYTPHDSNSASDLYDSYKTYREYFKSQGYIGSGTHKPESKPNVPQGNQNTTKTPVPQEVPIGNYVEGNTGYYHNNDGAVYIRVKTAPDYWHIGKASLQFEVQSSSPIGYSYNDGKSTQSGRLTNNQSISLDDQNREFTIRIDPPVESVNWRVKNTSKCKIEKVFKQSSSNDSAKGYQGKQIPTPPASYNNNQKVQYYLSKMGFNIGKDKSGNPNIDGDLGALSSSSLILFQYKMGMSISGRADTATLEALRKAGIDGMTYNDIMQKAGKQLQHISKNDSINGKMDTSTMTVIPGSGGSGYLTEITAVAWAKLAQAAATDSSNNMNRFILGGPISGYRSYSDQVNLWNLYVQKKGPIAAEPDLKNHHGTSNHGWGLAVDLNLSDSQHKATSHEIKWLESNASKYGFKPLKNSSGNYVETWHWDYNQ